MSIHSARVQWLARARLAVLLLVASLALPAGAQPALGQGGGVPGIALAGSPALAETTAQIMARQAQAPRLAGGPTVVLPNLRPTLARQAGPALAQGPAAGPTTAQAAAAAAFSLGLSFEGPSSLSPCATPPDTMGAVGPTQFIVVVNCNVVSYNKTTGLADGVLNTTPNGFFASVRSASTSDPHIRYDRLSQRWFVVMIDVAFPNNRVMLAVSDSATITAGTIWRFFFFPSAVGTHTSCLADYPTPGIDANALYIGVNQFCGLSLATATYAGSDGYVVQKSSVLGTGPIRVTGFTNIGGGDAYTPQGVDNPDPAAAEGYFVAGSVNFANRLNLVRVASPGSLTPTVSAAVPIVTANQGQPATQPHLGNTGGSQGQLDASDNRPLAATLRDGRLWTAMDVGVTVAGSTCVGVGLGTGATRDAVFWWDLQGIATGSTPAIVQSGSICDTAATNPAFFSYGTIGVNGQGHAVLGYTVAGAATFTEPGYSARLAGDAAGVMPTSNISPIGSHPYNPTWDTGLTNGFRRWGDYSYTSLDPCDDMTLWTIQEYASQNNTYGERISQVLAPPPATPSVAGPASVTRGLASVSVVVTGVSTAGSGFYDTPASMAGQACRQRISAAVSGGVTVNSITYTDPTHVTLDLSTASATAGLQTVTITNPDGQAQGAAILNVVDPTKLPATVTLTNLNQAYDGTPRPIGATTMPGGLTVDFTYNGSATPPTDAGSYSVTGTVNSATYAGSASGTLVVSPLATTAALDATPNPALPQQVVTLKATIATAAGPIPTGSVDFTVDGAPFVVALAGDGTASLLLTGLPPGPHAATASYPGSLDFQASATAGLTVVILHQAFLPVVIQ